MDVVETLLARNEEFARAFNGADLPILPRLRTVILTCIDARVDPAHVLGIGLGEAVVIRNNGGRATSEVIEEIASLAFLVTQLQKGEPAVFNIVIMQHTQCGAERFADPEVQAAMKLSTGVDVSRMAISDHKESLLQDVERLRNAPEVPRQLVVSAMLYDVATGAVREIIAPAPLE